MSEDLARVSRIRLEGLADFEFILDAASGPPSLDISGELADQTSHSIDGATLTIRGDAQPSSQHAVQISGSYVTGNTAIPFRGPVREALRVKYGTLGRPSLRIALDLPSGTAVTIEGPTGVISTATPGQPSNRDNSLDDTLRQKVDALLEKAREARSTGSLSGAIAAHEAEAEARKLQGE